MTNSQLIQRLVGLVKRETEITLEVIKYLLEVEERELHLEMSYSNLFDFATKFLKYSEGAASRRINAMRLLKALPSVEEKLRSGELTLSTADRVEAFCKKSGVDRLVAVKQVLGKGTRDAERALFELSPNTIPEERTRRVSDTHTELRLILDEEMMSDLNRIRELLSHANANMSSTEVFGRSMKALLSKIDPEKRRAASAPKSQSENDKPRSSPDTRLAKGIIRRIVWSRDQGQCTFLDKTTGRRCTSRHMCEIDHIIPWSHGGKTEVENLRVMCKAHNQFIYERPPN